MNISTFDEMKKTIQKSEAHVADISHSLLKYAIVDDSLTFVIDPIHREKALPFLEKVKKHRKANAEVKAALENAHALYFEHFKRRVEDPILELENTLASLRNDIAQKQSVLQHLTILNTEMKPAISEDKSEQASELRQDILFNLPEKIKLLEALLSKARRPFESIVIPPIPMKGFGLPGEVEQA